MSPTTALRSCRRASFVLVGVCALAACNETESGPAVSPTAAPSASQSMLVEADEEDEKPARPQKKGQANAAGERVKIPAGKLVSGSTPGDLGRDPSFEPALAPVEIAAFEIDKLPQPNDPSQPPITGVSREEAAATCKEKGGRLCTELEWEHACKGPEGQRYAGGDVWDEGCAKSPQTCASGFGVLAMGAAMREWTASDVQPIKEFLKQTGAAVRGAVGDAAGVDHRCAHRVSVDPSTQGKDLGFRCCYGDANKATIASPQWENTIRKADMSAEQISELFASNKRLAVVKDDIKFFRESAAIATVKRRGEARGDSDEEIDPNIRMVTAPSIWNPAPGEEVLLVTGQSGKNSFIVAFHRLPGGRHRVGAAMILEDELGPIVFAYNPYVRRKLEWATCWKCRAEAGFITYRKDNRVVITME